MAISFLPAYPRRNGFICYFQCRHRCGTTNFRTRAEREKHEAHCDHPRFIRHDLVELTRTRSDGSKARGAVLSCSRREAVVILVNGEVETVPVNELIPIGR